MLVYSFLLSTVLYCAHSAEPCGDIRNKKGCRKADHCIWKNKEKTCLMREGLTPPTVSPTSTEPTTMPTRLETSSPTMMPSNPLTPSPTAEPTSMPTPNSCAIYDSAKVNSLCSPFVDGNVADDVFEALMGCAHGPNCSANNSGKVDRTSYKYCNHHDEMTDADLIAEEMAIRTALLNSMSATCDKWCLFDAYKPFGRSWLWDNHGKCWKKQGNRGKCQKMSNSVRRSPEIAIVLDRAFGICEVPTDAPRAESILTKKRESCTEACVRVFGDELKCHAEGIEAAHNGRSKDDIVKMFAKAGTQCKSFAEGTADQAFPAYDSHTGQCATRHPGAVGNPCEKRPEDNYRRLCVCATWNVIENKRF